MYVYALVIRRTYYDCIHVLSHRSQVQSLNRDIIQPRWPWHCILRVEYMMALIAQLDLQAIRRTPVHPDDDRSLQ